MTVWYWTVVGALALPLSLVALSSISGDPAVGFPLSSVTLHWYRAAAADPALRDAFALSLVLALGSSALAVGIGGAVALTAHRLRTAWLRTVLLAAALAPLVTPGIVHAIAMRIAIRALGLDPGPTAILLGHAIHATPTAVIMLAARRATLPQPLLEAARDLGATPAQTFRWITAPWLAPAALGAFLLAAQTSFDDFIRSFFLGGYDPTLPVLIFARLRAGLTPEISAASTLALGLTVAASLLALRWAPAAALTSRVRRW